MHIQHIESTTEFTENISGAPTHTHIKLTFDTVDLRCRILRGT